MQATQAMIDGRAKALICLGGNFAVAMPDHERGFPAMGNPDLSVHVGTKLNRTHLLVGKETFIFPCLGRTELDLRATGRQSITVEDSMSMVHASSGKLKPASPLLRSEPAIVAGMAKATLPETRVDWLTLVEDYDRIRDLIEQTIPGFENYNARIRVPGASACRCRRRNASGQRRREKRCSRCSTAFTRMPAAKVSTFCG